MKNIIKTTLSEQIYVILREDIISQSIKCGDKLTIKALQERFNISSTPVREALNRLSQDGLIDQITNVGAKVVDIKENDIREIYDFCSALDVSAMKLALDGEQVDAVISELTRCIELQEQCLESENMHDFKLHSDNFHDIFFKHANNSRLYSASLKIRSQFSILSTRYQNFTIARSVVFIEHKEIAAAIVHKDFSRAMLLMTNHFEHAKSYLLSNIRNEDFLSSL